VRRSDGERGVAFSFATYVNVMNQYRPSFKASRIPELSRPVTRAEYLQGVTEARRAGLSRGLPDCS
jgi:putative pyruvate formate lyase activating enzyme